MKYAIRYWFHLKALKMFCMYSWRWNPINYTIFSNKIIVSDRGFFFVTCLHSPFHWWRIHFECFVAIINWITVHCIYVSMKMANDAWTFVAVIRHAVATNQIKLTVWHFMIDQIRSDWTTILSKWNQFTAVITSILHWLSYNAQGEAHPFAHFTNSLNA